MNKLIANLILWGSIGTYALPHAIDKEHDSKQATVTNHKYDNLDNQADLDDDIIYEASNKAREIKASE